MIRKFGLLFFVLIVFADIEARAQPDVTPSPMELITSFHDNIDLFRNCIDQSFVRTLGVVKEKQLQPFFVTINEHLSKVSRAFEDLTAPRSTTDLEQES